MKLKSYTLKVQNSQNKQVNGVKILFFFNFFFRVQLFTQLNQSIKELGDVENWSQHIDDDVQDIVKNIDVILELKQKK
jgi:hypothetical protein